MRRGGVLAGGVLLLLAVAAPARAQAPAGAVQQQGAPSSPFFGSVPKQPVSPEPLALSVKEAVQRALEHNLGLLLQEEAVNAAHGARWRALAELLPNLSALVTERRQVINLEAFGFPAPNPIVGPFNVFDARVALSQPVVDIAAINDHRAAVLNEQAEKYGIRSARDLVVLVTVNLYLESVAGNSRIDMVRAQLETADALFKQAQDLKGSGVVAGIDVLRAQVQVQTQRQRLIAAENDFEKFKLQLARAIGLPVGQAFTLTDKIPYAPMPPLTLDDTIARALQTRPDYLAARSRFEAAQASLRAANAEWLPTLHFDADYGTIGQTVENSHSTYTIGATVRLNVFDAGSTRARRIEALSGMRQREAELADFGSRVEYEVRTAFLDVRSAEQQLEAAQTSVRLASDELTQARDRFAAGVTSNLEVTQAQESVAAATDVYISALYAHNLAKASLARAVGTAESAVMSYIGGIQ